MSREKFDFLLFFLAILFRGDLRENLEKIGTFLSGRQYLYGAGASVAGQDPRQHVSCRGHLFSSDSPSGGAAQSFSRAGPRNARGRNRHHGGAEFWTPG